MNLKEVFIADVTYTKSNIYGLLRKRRGWRSFLFYAWGELKELVSWAILLSLSIVGIGYFMAHALVYCLAK